MVQLWRDVCLLIWKGLTYNYRVGAWVDGLHLSAIYSMGNYVTVHVGV